MDVMAAQGVVGTSLTKGQCGKDERDCFALSLRCHCVLAVYMEFSIRRHHAYTKTAVRPCHIGEDRIFAH